MVDPTTTNKIYAIPAHGTDIDTWDAPLNSNFSILDKNFGGVLTKSLSGSNVTLTPTEQQNGIIRFTGAISTNLVITFTAVGSYFMIDNLTTGAFSVQLRCGAGAAIATPQGVATYVMCDGTDFKFVSLDKPGSYWDYGGSAVPGWVSACTVPPYLICDGTTYSSVTYPHLFAVLGTTTLPDFRGRVGAYLDAGTGRITTAGSGIDGTTRFSGGGLQTMTLSQPNLPNTGLTVTNNATGATTLSSGGTTPISPSVASASSQAAFSSPLALFNTAQFNTISASTTVDLSAVTTSSMNSGVTQTATNNMPPAVIGGIRMIRAA